MSGILESVLWPAEIPAGLTGKGDGEQVEVRTGAEEFGINSRAVMEFISRDVFKSLWIVFWILGVFKDLGGMEDS